MPIIGEWYLQKGGRDEDNEGEHAGSRPPGDTIWPRAVSTAPVVSSMLVSEAFI